MTKLKFAVAALLLMLLPGCWNSKDIQNMVYITAIGLDYADGQYTAYTQFLNFESVARTENLQVGKEVPIWVGKGTGKTVAQALGSISATSQLQMFWGHVKVIIVTEGMMRKGLKDAYHMINRYREARYNVLIYGTKEKLDAILTQHSILNLSPLDSVMFSPNQVFTKFSTIAPMPGNRFISLINEPGVLTPLPSIGLDAHTWEADRKPTSMFKITGAFFLESDKLKTWMSEDELIGSRWIQPKLARTRLNVPSDEHAIASVVLGSPHYSVKPFIQRNEVRFRIEVKVKGFIEDILQDETVRQIELTTAQTITEEIKRVYQTGLRKNCDILRLEEELYRKYPRKFKELHRQNEPIINSGSLAEVKVKVFFKNTGKYKGYQK